MAYLRIALWKNLFIFSLVEHFLKKHENAKLQKTLFFSFMILNLVTKGILDFHVTTAANICMKELTDRCLRCAL